MLEWMRAEPLGGKEGAFEVRPDDARRRPVRGQRAEGVDDRALCGGDERRLVRRHAREQQRLPRALVVLGGRGEEVDTAEAVHLQVDEAGNGDPAALASSKAD